ncbi:hypothetical protein ACFX13_036979 [Malus domestica]
MDPSHPISSFHQIPPHPRIRGFALSFVLSLRINIKRESPDAIDADDDMVSGEGQRSGSGQSVYKCWSFKFTPSRRASSAHVQYEDEVDDEDTITLLPQLLLVSAVLYSKYYH